MSSSNNVYSVSCLVKSNPSAPVASKFNGAMRQSVTVQVGQEIVQIWENCPTIISTWKQGQTEYVRKNQRGLYQAVESYGEANAAPVEIETPTKAASVAARYTPHVVSVEPCDETKRQAVEYIKFQAKVYGSIFAEVQKEMQRFGLDVKEEKDIATTLYIQTVRKFSL